MRTTLTLDDDIAARLAEETRRTGRSLKQVVNETLRRGFMTPQKPEHRKKFKVRPFEGGLGLPEGLSYDSISTLIEQLEGPLHR